MKVAVIGGGINVVMTASAFARRGDAERFAVQFRIVPSFMLRTDHAS
jgi:hypothetical protein